VLPERISGSNGLSLTHLKNIDLNFKACAVICEFCDENESNFYGELLAYSDAGIKLFLRK
jgi:hypothetical protein